MSVMTSGVPTSKMIAGVLSSVVVCALVVGRYCGSNGTENCTKSVNKRRSEILYRQPGYVLENFDIVEGDCKRVWD